MAEGLVHESMNMASVLELPVVFVCENNLYGEMTPATEQHHLEGFEARGEVYDMPAERVDGMSVTEVYQATATAVNRVRDGDGPALIICDTYRYQGHYEGDPEVYRTEDEVEEWKDADPIDGFEEHILAEQLLDQDDIDEIEADATDRVDEAVSFARESDLPDPDTAYEGVYTEMI